MLFEMFPVIVENFVNKPPHLSQSYIVTATYGIRKKTGEKFLKVITIDKQIYIKTIGINGEVKNKYIKIPNFNTKEERDKLIFQLRNKGYIQDDIADFLGISQSTVSNVLKPVIVFMSDV